jgi:cell division protein FtsB
MAYFAIQAGQYGSTDLIAGWREGKRINAEIDSLRLVVDSLGRYRKRLDTDPALQERIARERFGMVKSDSELVYRFVDRDTTR